MVLVAKVDVENPKLGLLATDDGRAELKGWALDGMVVVDGIEE